MLAQYKNNTNIGVGLGIILEILGRVLIIFLPALALVGLLITLVGVGFFIWGCMAYAQGKGHSKWLGLLGLLSCIGLIVLVVMPDHHKEG